MTPADIAARVVATRMIWRRGAAPATAGWASEHSPPGSTDRWLAGQHCCLCGGRIGTGIAVGLGCEAIAHGDCVLWGAWHGGAIGRCCPVCEAAAGEPCTTRGAPRSAPHARRRGAMVDPCVARRALRRGG